MLTYMSVEANEVVVPTSCITHDLGCSTSLTTVYMIDYCMFKEQSTCCMYTIHDALDAVSLHKSVPLYEG